MSLFYLSLQLVFFWSYSTDLSFLRSFFLFVCLSNACRICLTLYLLLFHFSKSSSFFALRSESSWCRVCLNCKQTRASTLCVTTLSFGLHRVSQRTGGRSKNNLCTFSLWNPSYSSLHPDDVFDTSVSEATLFITQRTLQPKGESVTQYLEK